MLDEFENEFYRVEYSPIREVQQWSVWFGGTKIIRKDNEDIVYGKVFRGRNSPEAVQLDRDNWLREKFQTLSKPLDWGLDPLVSALIRKYLLIRNEAYGFVLEAEKASSPEEAREFYAKGESYRQDELDKLKYEIEQLSEAQKVELITPTLEQIHDPLRPEFEDPLRAKSFLYFLMGQPAILRESFDKLEEVFRRASELLLEMHPELRDREDEDEE